MENDVKKSPKIKRKKGKAESPNLFGAIFNLLYNKLGIQPKEMADYLGENNPNKVFDWTSSRQRPYRKKLPKITEYFIICLHERNAQFIKDNLFANIRYYIDTSNLPPLEKGSLLSIDSCEVLISECLQIAHKQDIPFIIPTNFKLSKYLLYNLDCTNKNQTKDFLSILTDIDNNNTFGLYPIFNMSYIRRSNIDHIFKSIETSLQYSNEELMQCSLTASGGIGKSQVLCQYCNDKNKNYERIYWLQSKNNWNLYIDFRNILIDSKISNENSRWALGRLLEDIEDFFEKVKGKDYLFIFEDILCFEKLKSHIPNNTRNSFIITSSEKLFSNVNISRFDKEESELYVLNRTGVSSYDANDKKIINEIVKSLNFHPLALEQASAYIKNNNCSYQEYLELIEKEKKEVEENYRTNKRFLKEESKNIIEDEISLAITYKIASHKFSNCAVSGFLNICSLLSPCAIQEDLFININDLLPYPLCSIAEKGNLSQIFDEIASYSIVNYYSDHKTIYINQLTQNAIKFSISGNELRWFDYVVDIISKNFTYHGEDCNGKILNKLLLMLPHILNVMEEWNAYTLSNRDMILECKNKTLQAKNIYQKIIDLDIVVNKVVKKIKGSNTDSLVINSLDF